MFWIHNVNFIFKNSGEDYFRKIEYDITLSELKKNNSVISLGGGAFLNNTIRKSAKKLSISIWLDVQIDELVKRLKKNTKAYWSLTNKNPMQIR